ncbi:MAG: metal ABC transporter permease [Anaerolineae bacterium]
MDILVNPLIEPLTYPFMQRGLLAAIIVGVVCAIIGSYVVLRGLAFMGDALAHAVLPGIAIAFLVGRNILVGAFLAAIITALGIGLVQRQGRLREDSAVGIMFVGAFALGILLISSMRSYSVDLTHILFGDVLAVSLQDLGMITALGVTILVIVLLLYKEFLLVSFDPVMAATTGLPVTWLNNGLLILLSLTIVTGLQVVGNILVVAMLIAPAATAYQLTDELWHMMLLSAVFGVVAAVVGLYLSFWFGVASGAAIVLTAVIIFFVVLVLTRKRRA